MLNKLTQLPPELSAGVLRFRFRQPEVEAAWQVARLPIARRVNATAAGAFAVLCALFLILDLFVLKLPWQVQAMRLATVLIGVLGVRVFVGITTIELADRIVTIATTLGMLMFWWLIWGALPEQDLRDYWLAGAVLSTAGAFVLFEAPMTTRVWLGVLNVACAGVTAFMLELSLRAHLIGFVHEFAVIGIAWLGAWQVERARRVAFLEHEHADKERQRAEAEKKRADDLLRNVLPESIAETLMANPGTIAQRHPNVTVLFADLVGFTPLSARLSAEEVVDHLDAIFTAFDQLCDAHGVEKIKTIGDAYMVAGGVPKAQDNHAEAVTAMALDMIKVVQRVSAESGANLQLRIGLNTGPVVAGVIGKRKFIYDLWGDTVNTASRMESHGIAGKVHVSEATAQLLGSDFEVEERGTIEVKGKGPMRTFLVQRTDGATPQTATA